MDEVGWQERVQGSGFRNRQVGGAALGVDWDFAGCIFFKRSAVDFFHLLGVVIPVVVALDESAAREAELAAAGGVVDQLDAGVGEGGGVAGWDEEAGLIVEDGFGDAADFGGDDGEGAG